MNLTVLAGGSGHCDDDNCPTVYVTDRATIAIQGAIMLDTGNVNPPQDETLVEIPLELFRAAARAVE